MEQEPLQQSEVQPIQSNSKKKLIIFGVIAVFLVASVVSGAGLYFFVFNKSEPEEVVTEDESQIEEPAQAIEDEIVSWEVYRNEEYGFEFKYPEDFYAEITNIVRIEKISNFSEKSTPYLTLTDVLNERAVISNSNIGYDCAGESEIGLRNYCKIEKFGEVKGKFSKFYIGEDPSFGISFIFYRKDARISVSGHRGLPELYPLDSKERIKKFNEYFDSVARKDPNNPDLIHYDTFEKILSTLKFIEPDKTAGWKTYRNEEYGFEVKHPEDWYVLGFKSTTPKVNIPLVIANAKLSERDTPGSGEIEVNFYTLNDTWSSLDDFVNEWGLPENGAERVISDHNELVGNYLAEGTEISEKDVNFYREETQIAKTSIIKTTLECKVFCAYLGGSGIQISYYLNNGQSFYEIWAQLSERNEDLENTLNQILSTFKFIE